MKYLSNTDWAFDVDIPEQSGANTSVQGVAQNV